MSLEPFAWLTAEFVEEVLKNSETDVSIKVKNLTTESAVGKGENYGSEMIRAMVEYTRNKLGLRYPETISLIVKIMPLGEESNKELVTSFQSFAMEISMMENTLVKMAEILNEKDFRFNARVLAADIEDPAYLVMEDLAPLGYRMANRWTGLDLEHCILTMRNLAKFHASSVALNEKEPELQTMYTNGMFQQHYPESWKQYCRGGMKKLAKDILKWPELGSEQKFYAEKIAKLSDVCYNKACECVNQKSSEFNVLNHGDCWLNNLMFRYDDKGKVTDHIFVDFQLPVWNSPAIDIINFFSTSPSPDVLLHHREALLEEYLNTLTKTLTKLGCKTKPPNVEALEKTLEDYAFYDVLMSCLFLPVVLLEKGEALTLNEIAQDNDYDSPTYRSQSLRIIMSKRLPAWNARGLLDV